MTSTDGLIAVDIGNSSIKWGRFGQLDDDIVMRHVVRKSDIFRTSTDAPDWDALSDWLGDFTEPVIIASVCRPATAKLCEWLQAARPTNRFRVLETADFDLPMDVEQPLRVGHDRLAAAVAARHLKSSDSAALVIDAGSAITVDLVSAEGVFLGGAILPGWRTMARALAVGTDALPELNYLSLTDPPSPLGRSTEQAISGGLFWGLVGAIRELANRLESQTDAPCELFVSGGDMQALVQHLDRPYIPVADLVLMGVWLAASNKDSD